MTTVLTALALLWLVADGPNVTDRWELLFQRTFDGRQGKIVCTLDQRGDVVNGKCGPDDVAEWTVSEGVVTWRSVTWYDNHTATIFYEGEIASDGRTIRGTWRCPKHCENAAYKDGPFVLTRLR